MPTPTSYTYPLSAFPDGKVVLSSLEKEIGENPAITIAVSGSTKSKNGLVTINFKDILPAEAKEALDGSTSQTPNPTPPADSAIGAHTGEVLSEETVDSQGRPIVTLSAPAASDGTLRVQSEPLEGNKVQLYSVNFVDKTTWYGSAARRTNVTLVNTGNDQDFELPDGPKTIIDCCRGRNAFQRKLREDYGLHVFVDGVRVMPHPLNNFGTWDYSKGSYSYDSERGDIKFFQPVTGTVTASYSEVIDSEFILKPGPGKELVLTGAELQFALDVSLRDALIFCLEADVDKYPDFQFLWNGFSNPVGGVPVGCVWDGTDTVLCSDTSTVSVGDHISLDSGNLHAPNPWYQVANITPNVSFELNAHPKWIPFPSGAGVTHHVTGARGPETNPQSPTGYGPFPAGTKIPLTENIYDTVMDIVAESNRAHPVIYKTKNTESTWRDLKEDIQIFHWDYASQAAIVLRSSWNMQVRIWFEQHIPSDGWLALATFYALSRPDPFWTGG